MGQPTQGSGTAAATAFLRALAAYDLRGDLRGQDNLAEIILDDELRRLLADPARAKALQHIAPGAYEFMLARTAYFDQIFAQALREHFAQNDNVLHYPLKP